MKKNILWYLLVFLIAACNNTNQNKTAEKNTLKDTTQTAIATKINTEDVLQIKDTAQQYFKVAILKNNQLYINYEGDFPLGIYAGKNFNLQFPASKKMMKISHYLVVYFKEPEVGTFPIVASGNEKGKPTLIFTPEVDGSYGIGVAATEGQVTITKYTATSVSGNLTAKGKDTDGNKIEIKAVFQHVSNNNVD